MPRNKKQEPTVQKKKGISKKVNRKMEAASLLTEHETVEAGDINLVMEPISNSPSNEKNSLLNIARFLSGESSLGKERERAEELKKKAKEKQREAIRTGIKQGLAELEPEGQDKKIVQNIKLFEWTAPIRVKFFFDFKAFLGIVSLMLVFILYLAILGHYALMGVMIALVFFIYVAGAIEPISVTHKITARGIETFDKLYEWFLLENFYFAKKNGQTMLYVGTKLRFPTRLIMLLDEKEITPLFMLLQDKVLYKDIRKQGFIDKATYGIYIPLENI
jgi:hypothetical protein